MHNMNRQAPSLLQSTVVDRAIDSEPVVYVRLSDGIDSPEEVIKLNNNDHQRLTSFKMPGLVDPALSLAEEGFLPAYTNAIYTTSHQVRSWVSLVRPYGVKVQGAPRM
jgi:hypothetical protein